MDTGQHSLNTLTFRDAFGEGTKILWIASSGGHVAQAHRIENIVGVNPDSVWVTFDVPQTRSLLEDRRVDHAEYVAPRAIWKAIKAAATVNRVLSRERFDHVISTGSAIAFFSLPLARMRGNRVTYVESLARSTGPSLTGRLMQMLPGIRRLTQYPNWAGPRWAYSGTVLDSFSAAETHMNGNGSRRIFVTLGTIRPYRFDRLVDAVLSIIGPDDHLVWQLGVTARDDLPGEVHAELPGHEMNRQMELADVIVTHAGVGSILAALQLGKAPVVAIRREAHGEHIDDHQQYIANVMESRGLATILDPDSPTKSALDKAARLEVETVDV